MCSAACCCQEAHAISQFSCVSTRPPYKPHSLIRADTRPAAAFALPVKPRFAETQTLPPNLLVVTTAVLTVPPSAELKSSCSHYLFSSKFIFVVQNEQHSDKSLQSARAKFMDVNPPRCFTISQLLNVKMFFVCFIKRDQQRDAGLPGHKHTVAVPALNTWLTFYASVAPHLLFGTCAIWISCAVDTV